MSVMIMERIKARRPICSVASLLQGIVWIPILLFGILYGPSERTVNLLLCASAIYFFVGAMGGPPWGSLISEIVPEALRGRYFGYRSKVCGFATFASLLAAGQILYLFGKTSFPTVGYVVIFSIACIGRLISAYWLGRYPDLPFTISTKNYFSFWQFIRATPRANFARFVFFTAFMNFGVNIAGPYFALYMLRELKMTYMEYTVAIAATIISQFFTLRHWGEISDRFGNKKIINLSSAGIIILPWLWLFSKNTAYIVVVQLLSGVLWAGFNLAVGNFLYDAVTPPKRARCLAYSSVVNGVFVFLGSIIGGFLLSNPPAILNHVQMFSGTKGAILFVFLLSGIVRLVVAVTLLPRFNEVRRVERIRHRQILFKILTLRPVSGESFGAVGKVG